MLVLTRKKEEGILIDNKIMIRVLDIDDSRVKIGIEAPKDIEIVREEIYLQIEKANISHVGKTSDQFSESVDAAKKLLKK